MQKAWKWRADRLNRRAPVGVIRRLPPSVRNAPSTNKLVCGDIADNWCVFRTKLEKYLFAKRRERHIYKRFNSGIESVRKGRHTYLEMYMCTSLLICLFGVSYSLVNEHVVHSTPRVTILHYYTTSSIQALLNLANECPAKYERNEHLVQLAAKVYFQLNGRNCYGYIIDEDETHWVVKRSNNSVHSIRKIKYNPEQTYKRHSEICAYPVHINNRVVQSGVRKSQTNEDHITVIWITPIRIQVHKKQHVEKNFKILSQFLLCKN